MVEVSDFVVKDSTISPQESNAPIRLELWKKAVEWYNRFNAIERAEGGKSFITLREAYSHMVEADEQEQQYETLFREGAKR